MAITLTGVLQITVSLSGVIDNFVPVVGGESGSPMGWLLLWTYS